MAAVSGMRGRRAGAGRPGGPSRTSRARTPGYRLRRALAVTLLGGTIAAVAFLILSFSGSSSQHRGRTTQAERSAAAAARASRRTRPASRHGSATRAGPGPYRVGKASIRVLEPAANAAPNAKTSSGQPARALPTVVRYPALGTAGGGADPSATPDRAAGPFPLVVFSQGYDFPAEGYSALLDAWARAGYVVADPTYPFTDPSTPGGAQENDIVNHPADLRFVISTLLSQSNDSGNPLHGMLKASAVAVIGHSDGGDVTLAAAVNTCCRDPAVKAAVILSGAELGAFGGTYYGSGGVPLLVIQGDADTVNLPGCSVELYDQAPAPKYYVNLPGAEHQPPYLTPGPTRSHVTQAVIGFLDGYLKNEPAGLLSLRRAASAAGIATITSSPTLPGLGTYCP